MFTQQPANTIRVKEGAPIPDLVWKYDPASDVSVQYRYTALGRLVPDLLIMKLWGGRRISLVDRVYLKDQATLVFRNRASKSDEGSYTCILRASGTKLVFSINLNVSSKFIYLFIYLFVHSFVCLFASFFIYL